MFLGKYFSVQFSYNMGKFVTSRHVENGRKEDGQGLTFTHMHYNVSAAIVAPKTKNREAYT